MKLKALQGVESKKIKNIIFDLGGVILNIDYSLTINAFINLGIKNFDQIYGQMHQSDLFDRLDKGLVTADAFRQYIRQQAGVPISDEQFDHAWNAMLLDVPKEHIELLKKVSQHYRIFILSNTNEIHLNSRFRQLTELLGDNGFGGLFEKEYYSNLVHMRKPDAEIYHLVVNENQLKSDETLFIDDTPINVEGAKNAGLQAFYLSSGMDITNLFH